MVILGLAGGIGRWFGGDGGGGCAGDVECLYVCVCCGVWVLSGCGVVCCGVAVCYCVVLLCCVVMWCGWCGWCVLCLCVKVRVLRVCVHACVFVCCACVVCVLCLCVVCVVRASVVCFVSLFLVVFPSSSVAPWRCFILDFDSKEIAMVT